MSDKIPVPFSDNPREIKYFNIITNKVIKIQHLEKMIKQQTEVINSARNAMEYVERHYNLYCNNVLKDWLKHNE